MAKNLYRMYSPLRSEYGIPDFNYQIKVIMLSLHQLIIFSRAGIKMINVLSQSNPKYFWALPKDDRVMSLELLSYE